MSAPIQLDDITIHPVIEQQGAHRLKVSVVAALWKTAGTGLVRLHHWAYPEASLAAEDYAEYLEDLLQQRLPGRPVIVVHDEGCQHRQRDLHPPARPLRPLTRVVR